MCDDAHRTELSVCHQLLRSDPNQSALATRMARSEDGVALYFIDHSPWGQAAAMALHLRGIPFRVVNCPSPWSLITDGFGLPVLWDGDRCFRGTNEILEHIDGMCTDGDVTAARRTRTPVATKVLRPFEAIACAEEEYQFRAEELMETYAMGRPARGVPSFVYRFSLAHVEGSWQKFASVLPSLSL